MFQFRNKDGNLFCEFKDRLYIVVCELSKLKDKPLEDMNQMEKYIYYLRYCQKGNENSKIKAVEEDEEGLQIIESRVDELTEHEWESINKAWEEIARHEELQDIRRAKEKGIEQGAFEKQKEMYTMMHSNGASLEQIARLCSVSVADIESILK